MTDLTALKAANGRRWASCKPLKQSSFNAVAKHLVDAKQRYLTVANKTGVPWFIIAVIHEREASQNWFTQLGQGDPLDRASVHVPKGRGPFATWEEGACDALVNCAPFAARNKDWSVGAALTVLEGYNGYGYSNRGVPSPYLWSGTDQYKSGKYVRDGVYDPNAVDGQLGCAGLLMAMMALDPSIALEGTAAPTAAPLPPKPIAPKPPAPALPAKQPSITNPAKGSIGDAVASVLSAIFKAFRK